jgi:hypothetical protein
MIEVKMITQEGDRCHNDHLPGAGRPVGAKLPGLPQVRGRACLSFG